MSRIVGLAALTLAAAGWAVVGAPPPAWLTVVEGLGPEAIVDQHPPTADEIAEAIADAATVTEMTWWPLGEPIVSDDGSWELEALVLDESGDLVLVAFGGGAGTDAVLHWLIGAEAYPSWWLDGVGTPTVPPPMAIDPLELDQDDLLGWSSPVPPGGWIAVCAGRATRTCGQGRVCWVRVYVETNGQVYGCHINCRRGSRPCPPVPPNL